MGPKIYQKIWGWEKKRKGFQCNQTPASSSSSFPSRLQKCQRYWNYIHWFLKVFNFQFPHFSCFRSRMISRWMSFDKRFSFKSSPREWKRLSRVQGSQFYWTFFCCCIFKIFFVKRSKQKGGIKNKIHWRQTTFRFAFLFLSFRFLFWRFHFLFLSFLFFLPFYSHLSSHRSKRNSGIIKIETPPRQTKFPLPDLVFYPFEVCICICTVYFLCQTLSFIRLRWTIISTNIINKVDQSKKKLWMNQMLYWI